MKSLKHLFLVSLFGVALSVSAAPATKTTTIAAGGFTNLLTLGNSGNANITQVILTSPTTNATRIRIVDSPTNTLTFTNAAYIQLQTYATNVITTYTNYFGVANSFTNVGLIDVTNTVAATTNNYPIRFTATSPTNTSSIFTGTYSFNNGVWATNESLGGSVTVTVTYEQ